MTRAVAPLARLGYLGCFGYVGGDAADLLVRAGAADLRIVPRREGEWED